MSDVDEIVREVFGEEDEESASENVGTEKHWSRTLCRLLISKRFAFQKKFEEGKKKKGVLWNQILRECRSVDPIFPFTAEEIMRKFNNLLTTYKRTKKRASRSGAGRIFWEFYEEFDKVFGTKHSIQPPDGTTMATLQVQPEEDRNVSASIDGELSDDSTDAPPPKRCKSSGNTEIINFLKSQFEKEENRLNVLDKREEIRFQQLLKTEQEKNEIERSKVKAISDLKEILVALIR